MGSDKLTEAAAVLAGAAGSAGVWPRNADAVRLVCSTLRSWRRDPWTNRSLGLDYPALLAAAQWMELDIGEDLWMRVRWLESEMLRLLPAPPCNRDGME